MHYKLHKRVPKNQKLFQFEKEDFSKIGLYDFNVISDWNDLISTSSKQESLSSVVARNLDIDKASRPGTKSIFQYLKPGSFFIADIGSTVRTIGSYSGFVFTLALRIQCAKNFLLYMSGYQYISPKSSVREKLTYFVSPTNYSMKQDRSSIRLESNKQEKLYHVLKTSQASSQANWLHVSLYLRNPGGIGLILVFSMPNERLNKLFRIIIGGIFPCFCLREMIVISFKIMANLLYSLIKRSTRWVKYNRLYSVVIHNTVHLNYILKYFSFA